MAKKFSNKEALRFSWEVTKANLGFFISLFAGVLVIYLGFGVLQNFADRHSLLSLVVSLADWFLQVMVSIGLLTIPLKFVDGQKADYGHLFSGYHHILRYFSASLLYMLIVLGGLVLLVVPGIIWAIRFQFFGYLIVDKNLGPIEALKRSWAITKGSVGELFTFSLLLALINLAGMLALMVGLFITVPISLLATAFVYRKLLGVSSQPATATV